MIRTHNCYKCLYITLFKIFTQKPKNNECDDRRKAALNTTDIPLFFSRRLLLFRSPRAIMIERSTLTQNINFAADNNTIL